MHRTKISVTLKPHFYNRWPRISVGLDDDLLISTPLMGIRTYTVDHCIPNGPHELWVRYEGKTNEDSTVDGDQAVEILDVTAESISSDKFVWAGVYTPEYPEPWASQQTDLASELTNVTYLGWNGVWRLRFTTPVFRWIHETEHLGWIYD